VPDRGVRDFTALRPPCGGALALDGKSAPHNRPGGPDSTRMPVAAVEHGAGVILGQVPSDGGEILGVGRLPGEISVAGRTITLDALNTCRETAALIVDGGGDCVMPVKEGNRKTVFEDVSILDRDDAPSRRTLEKGHRQIEERVCSVVPLDDMPDEMAALPGSRQAFRIVRNRTCPRTGKPLGESQTAYGLTSLAPLRAGPSEILALNRGHREIENRLHYVRDVSCGEDRSTVRVGAMPRNLACLSNAAISIVRMCGEFRCLPPARRHQSAGKDRALREILNNPAI